MISDLCEDRTRAFKSASTPLCYITKDPYYLVIIFAARTTHGTHMHSSAAEKREVMMADDVPQPPIKQLATAQRQTCDTRAV